MKKYIVIAATLLLVGCTTTFYSSVVTVTEVRKSVMNELGALYRAGKISPQTDVRIEMADASFRLGAKAMEAALIAYKNGTSTNNPADKIELVKQPVRDMIEILAPLVITKVSNQHINDLNKATKL